VRFFSCRFVRERVLQRHRGVRPLHVGPEAPEARARHGGRGRGTERVVRDLARRPGVLPVQTRICFVVVSRRRSLQPALGVVLLELRGAHQTLHLIDQRSLGFLERVRAEEPQDVLQLRYVLRRHRARARASLWCAQKKTQK